MKRYARLHGYGVLTESFSGYKAQPGRGTILDKTHNAYSLGQVSPLVTSCRCNENGGCRLSPGNHSCRCGNNCLN